MTKPKEPEDSVKPMDDEKTELNDIDLDGVNGGFKSIWRVSTRRKFPRLEIESNDESNISSGFIDL